MPWCAITMLDWGLRQLARRTVMVSPNMCWRSTAGRIFPPPSPARPRNNEFPRPGANHIPEDTMTDPELYAGLNDIVRQVLDDDTIAVSPEMTAEDVPGWDSMNHIFIVVEIEKRFGVKFQA